MPRDIAQLDLRLPLLPRPQPLAVVEAMRLWPRDLVKDAGGVIRISAEVARKLVDLGCLEPVGIGQRGNFCGRYIMTRLPA